MISGILEEMNMDDVRALDPQVALLGVASTEPHGPILPYGTDYFQCDAVCRRAAVRANAEGGRVLMYPTLAIGNNVNFKGFPFACRISVRTLMLVLLDIIQALEEDGIRKIVLIDGHGGNTDAIHATLREHFDRTPADRRAFVCVTRPPASPEAVAAVRIPSDHGGESEVSRMMYLHPELIDEGKLRELPVGRPVVEFIAAGEVEYVKPWHRHVPEGGGGETRHATADKGRDIIETAADRLAEMLVELSNAPWNPEFPYPPVKR